MKQDRKNRIPISGVSLGLHCLPVLLRRHPVVFLEDPDKIIHIIVAAGCRHHGHGNGAGVDQDKRLTHADAVEIVGQRHPDFFFEETGEIGLGDAVLFRKEIEAQILRIVKIDIRYYFPHHETVAFHGVVLHQQTIAVQHVEA